MMAMMIVVMVVVLVMVVVAPMMMAKAMMAGVVLMMMEANHGTDPNGCRGAAASRAEAVGCSESMAGERARHVAGCGLLQARSWQVGRGGTQHCVLIRARKRAVVLRACALVESLRLADVSGQQLRCLRLRVGGGGGGDVAVVEAPVQIGAPTAGF